MKKNVFKRIGEKVEDFCGDHLYTIEVASILATLGAITYATIKGENEFYSKAIDILKGE